MRRHWSIKTMLRVCELLIGLSYCYAGWRDSFCTPVSMTETENMYYATGYRRLYLLTKVVFGGKPKTGCHTNL